MSDSYKDPIFGQIRLEDGDYWTAMIKHGKRRVEADLNLESDLDPETIGALTTHLADLKALEATAHDALREEHEASEDSNVALFMEHHAEELDAKDLAKAFPQSKTFPNDLNSFLSGLQLSRVGLYPSDPEHSIVADFTLAGSVTDYVLTVAFNREGNVVDVEMES